MILTVKSDNERVELYHDSEFRNDVAILTIPGMRGVINTLTINHSDIDDLTDTLKLYKDRIKEVLG